ncbi:MAG: CRISPR-associated protein Cas4, partial [Candidatus Sedimenticola sp. (ex Thyasira tokunagai)]
MDTFKDDDLLPISALQHYAYCPRQFALIHLEQIWEENRFTAEGQLLHQRVNSGETETRGDLHIARTLRLRSTRLGLTGIADVVEFYRTERGGVKLHGCSGAWQPLPVEYKRGRSKTDDWDRLQLCAQAFCLEEVFETTIQEGAIFYGKPRRREQVSFQACRYLVKDFGTSKSPKSTRLRDSRYAPTVLRTSRFRIAHCSKAACA